LIHCFSYFLGLNQHTYPDNGSNSVDLVFSNFSDLSVDRSAHGPVEPDHLRHFITACAMSVPRYEQNF
jgi:hypothetical protein